MGPDGMKVEFVENEQATAPIVLHHIHFFTPDVTGMRDWYARTLQARPGRRGSFETADLPEVNLTFAASADPVVGTRGRVLDRIGFATGNLAALCSSLEKAGVIVESSPATHTPRTLAAALITDPWGTDIELTDGLR
jgi:hypothetical protein